MSRHLFAKNMKYLMQKRNVTKQQLADHLRLKPTRITAWLQARSFPRQEQMLDVCNALDFFDIYRMMTVDLTKGKHQDKKPMPAEISTALKSIQQIAQQVLKQY